MKYLFFDFECANCFDGIGKICEFGYVLTDENFNVISKDAIPMSPGRGRNNRFSLTGRKDQRDLILAWDYDYYYDQPEFPHFYEKIKKLMCNEDTVCFGFACDNDISYLYHTCKRYDLETFDYICYDVQKIAINYLDDSRSGLKNTYLKLVGKEHIAELQEHLSRDDAFMTMKILEVVCVLKNTTSKNLLGEYIDAKTSFKQWLEALIASQHIDEDAVCNMSAEEQVSFSALIKDLYQFALQYKDKNEPDIVSALDAFKALYIADNIKFNKDGDVLLFLTSMALINTYVKQKDSDKRIGYWFKDLLKGLLLETKRKIFKSLKINYIDKELNNNNILIFEFNKTYQFSYHCVDKRLSKLILNEYKCDSAYWGIRNKDFINELFKRVCENTVGFSNLTRLEENLLENANKFANDMVNNQELKTNVRKRRGDGKIKSESFLLWDEIYAEHKDQIENEDSVGRRYSISALIKEDLNLTTRVISIIKQNNLLAANEVSKSDYLIVLNEEDKKRLLGVLKHPYSGTMITLNEFEKM